MSSVPLPRSVKCRPAAAPPTMLLATLLPLFFSLPYMCCLGLPDKETRALVELKDMLENPAALSEWGWQTDFCNLQPTAAAKVRCDNGGSVSHLQITGERPNSNSASGQGMLSERFSSEALILHLTNFTNLRVLQLTSLGLWGPLPSKLGRLSSLESLNLSLNYFSGVVPNRITSLRRLRLLSLDSNLLTGSLPLRWHGPSLRFLSVSRNRLSGQPPDLSGLSSLQSLDLHDNQFGPAFPSLPAAVLVSVSLSRNRFDGPIPASVAGLVRLRQLDMSYNRFSGVAPPALFSLPTLNRLDIAGNRLTGTLPPSLTLSRSLTYVDISYNLISGPLPPAVVALIGSGNGAKVRFQGNCLSTELQPQHVFSYCQNAALGLDIGDVAAAPSAVLRRRRGRGTVVVVLAILAALLGFAIALFLLLFGVLRWQQRRREGSESGGEDGGWKQAAAAAGIVDHKSLVVSSEIFSSARYITRTRKLAGFGWPQFRLYTAEEIYKATCRFHSSMFMGDGGHGKVYKGQTEDGTWIAVKVLREEEEEEVGRGRLKVLKAHVEHLGKFRHKNLVTLLGYGMVETAAATEEDGDEDGNEDDDTADYGLKKMKPLQQEQRGGGRMYLVYEYVAGTTLRAKLAGFAEGFGWLHRLEAIIGAAKALHFLHCGLVPGVFDNNVTSNNVLFDQNRVPKLSDYGLSIRRVDDQPNDDQHQNLWSLSHAVADKNRKEGGGDKTDVYNFGLILLETLIGKLPSIQALESFVQADLEQEPRLDAIDPVILAFCNVESLQTVVDIAVKCLCQDPKGRPSMEDVLWNLQYAYQVQTNIGVGEDQVLAADGLLTDHPRAVLLAGNKRRKKTVAGGSNLDKRKSCNEEVGDSSSPSTEPFP